MDAAKKKAIFRAKLNAQKKEKRIDSPLVRYNEFDQPLCRICNVVLKSESLWDAHQASRKHHEAINVMKANAGARVHVGSAKPEASSRPKQADNVELHDTKYEPAAKLSQSQASSVLPTDFFDNETKLTSPKHVNKSELYETSTKLQKPQSSSALPPDFFDNPEAKRKKTGHSVKSKEESLLGNHIDGPPSENPQTKTVGHAKESIRTTDATGSETKQTKGALPEGFFDDKEADLRARGIKLVKPDVKDEYKEFEKLIQEDLQEVDNRMEEEEIDAAETIEEAESLEQRSYREKVEMLKKRKMELAAARLAKRSRSSGVGDKVSSQEESSSEDDDDDNENYAVDWRAQHL
ncbi:protein ABA AND ROS SENSITIVE 1 isoform X2 [Euphorbia lathyris]|uniref:protein ABA AND ROS SENSITIVE 1 isoform X2 n=1 Tax=Euphorbia lathyris TaxID=212925 RepID=UPI0033137EC4